MTEILLFFLLPLLLLLLLFLPILLPKIAKKYMSRTQVPEEDQRVSTISDLKNYEPRPKAIVRTEGKNAPNDKLENLYWWDPDGDAANAGGDEIIESNVSGYGDGEIDEGVWRRFVSPMSEARNQIDLKDTSSVNRTAGYSLLNARYTGKSAFWYKDVSDMALLRELNFNDDGTKIYLNGTTNNIIEQYSLSTPYDISTNTFETRINTASDFDWSSYGGAGEDPVASDFVNGGSDLFFLSQDANLDGGQGAIQKISLSTPYDLSSTTTADGGIVLSSVPSSIEFHPNDGSRFFSGDAKGGIEEYNLDGGAFDLSGGISRANLLDISSNVGNPRSFTFNDDGRAFFTTGFSSDKVYKFELGAPYDITESVELTETFDISETMSSPEFITFNGDGSNFFLGYTSSGKYYEFESTVSRIDVRNTLSGSGGISFDSDTGEISTTTTNDITEGSDSLYYTSERVRNELKTEGGLNYAKNTAILAGTKYSGTSFDVSSETSSPQGFTFNGSGDKLFMTGASNQNVYEYNLSSAYDISTISYSGTSFNVGGEVSQLQDVAFGEGGTKMFICDSVGDIYQYELNTGFDLSTASYSNTTFEVGGIGGEEESPRGFGFSGDGTKMLVLGTDSKKVHEYGLSTGFDLSTASYSNKSFDVTGEEQFPRGLEFSGSGKEMFVFGAENNSIIEYNLNSSFDISTASYANKTLDPTSQSSLFGIAFSDGETKLFSNESNSVFEYDINEEKAALSANVSGNTGAVQRSDGSGGFAGDTSDFYVDPSTGNVGIGTDSPSRNVHIKDETENNDGLLIGTNDGEPITVRNTGFADPPKTFFVRHDTNIIEMGAGYDLNFLVNGEKKMYFSSAPNGGVGIGTQSASTAVSGRALTLAQENNSNDTAFAIETSDDSASTYIDFDDSQGQGSGGRIKYDHGDDSLRFGTNGATEQMRIDSAGKVGIGTNSPNAPLTVDGTNESTLTRIYSNQSAGYDGLVVDTDGESNNDSFKVRTNSNASNFSDSDTRFLVRGDGNVGIGTGSPNTRLKIQGGRTSINVDSKKALDLLSITQDDPAAVHFNSGRTQNWSVGMGLSSGSARSLDFREISGSGSTDTKPGMQLSNYPELLLTEGSGGDNTSIQLDGSNNRSYLQYENSTALTFNSSGNVGIGKSSPSKALDVAGQVTMDDTYIRNLSNVSSNTTTSGDDFYSVNTSGGSVTLTLSSSDAETGRVIHVKRNGTQKVTIDTQGSETIEGRSSAQLGTDDESVRLVYNGANSDWEIY